jgi:hypothetical protein
MSRWERESGLGFRLLFAFSNYWQKKSKEYISEIREGKDMGWI